MKTKILFLIIVASLFPSLNYAATPGQIIFASNRSGNYEIYKKNLATGVIVNLTNNPADDLNPEISRDGQSLVFYSNRAGNNQIYKISLQNPGSVTRLTNDGASDYDPTFMPDGRILYKSNYNDGYGDIWLMNADGTSAQNLTRSLSSTEEYKPDWICSSVIIFTSRLQKGNPNSDELFSENITTGVITRITNNTVPDWFPAVNSTGTSVAFISKEKTTDHDSIYTMSSSNQLRTRITNPNVVLGDSDDPSWSPDGQNIIFLNSKNGTTTFILWIVTVIISKLLKLIPVMNYLRYLFLERKASSSYFAFFVADYWLNSQVCGSYGLSMSTNKHLSQSRRGKS